MMFTFSELLYFYVILGMHSFLTYPRAFIIFSIGELLKPPQMGYYLRHLTRSESRYSVIWTKPAL